ncbi:MAG: chemotaxis protein CheA [Erythrobacter sp.]|uniref:chemotaxis protein CheA n=1 Tax=Marinobacter alexandrii TaxID=2570351 RepID=UPI003298FE9D
MDELLADFVAETREMLEASEGEIIAWEADPADRSRLDAIFRFVHTVKGNCGFFDFPRLAGLSHAAEDVLGEVRANRREADTPLVSAVLAIIDRISKMVDAIEAGEEFPEGGDEELIAALAPQSGSEIAVEAVPATAPVYEPAEPAADIEETDPSAAQEDAPQKVDQAVALQRSIRLPVDLLDRVMSGVSDMVLARNDLAHRLRQAGNQPTIDGPFERLTTILSDVRDAITRMRMQRIETLFGSLPRLVRDLSADLGKQVMIDLEGGDVELDREMIETVRDPLTHIIRNAIDHGIESPSERLSSGKREIGLLSISARQSGNTISIVVSDDGNGLNEEKIAAKAVSVGLATAAESQSMSREKILQMIFQPGFSTAETISNVSGRGVGLDVVRDNLEKVGGTISVSSTPGVGSMFTLQVPLTLSIIAGLTVGVGEQRFAIPQSYVEEIIHNSAKSLDFSRVGDTSLITFRGERIPCLSLGEVLDLGSSDMADSDQTMVLLRLASGDLFALAVDRIHHHGDLVVKPLAPAVMKSGFYAGSTLLDDGQPILLLDVTNIASRYDLVSDARTRVFQDLDEASADAANAVCRAMLFTDYAGRRCAVRLELVRRIETAKPDAVTVSENGTRAVIDGVILPVIGLPKESAPMEKVRMLRLSDDSCELLYAVRQIDDAVELDGALKQVRDDPLVEALTLIGDETITLIDGHQLFSRFGEPPEITGKPTCQIPESDWARTILAPLVKAAGYDVVATSEEPSDITIVLDEADITDDIGTLSSVIRIRSQPDGSDDNKSIYRYDRDGLIDALRHARAGGVR